MEAMAGSPEARSPSTFRQRYCQYHRIGPEVFERHLFVRSVRWPWRAIAPVLVGLFPRAFRRDFRELAASGNAMSLDEIRQIASDFRKSHDPRESRTFLRDNLGIRISGRIVMKAAQQLWDRLDEVGVRPVR